MKRHNYAVSVEWTGNSGQGTKTYRTYLRDYAIVSAGKPEIRGSSDPSFRGDPLRYNPEELLVASLSSCHMLSYLHLCAVNGVNVIGYVDAASGTMAENQDGGGTFVQVLLQPRVTIAPDSSPDKALALHQQAHHLCFIANSVNFPVGVEPQIVRGEAVESLGG